MAYKKLADKIIYEPVAGLTIEEAVREGMKISKSENKIVEMNINDIIVYTAPNSVFGYVIARYYRLLNEKYKREQAREQVKDLLQRKR